MQNTKQLIQLALFIVCTGLILGLIFCKNQNSTHFNSKINREEYLLESFNTMDKWTLQSDENTSASVDSTFISDQLTIKLSAIDSPAMMSSTTTFNLDDYTGGEVSFYVEHKENIEYVAFYFATEPELKGPFGYVVFENYQLTEGWNTLPFSTDQIVSSNGITPNSSINTMQVLLQPKKGEASIYLDSINLINADNANVVFIMDDGWESQYSTGFRILNAYDIPGNIAVVPSLVNSENYMHKDQLNKMYKHGWDLLNHTFSHSDLGKLNLDEQRQEITDGMNWLNKNGFTRASDSVVYPYGSYNEDTFKILEEIESPFGRTVQHGIETPTVNADYEAKVINLTSEISMDYAKQHVKTAVATGNTVIFLNHKFGDETDPMYYSEEKFESIVKYVKAQVDAGKVKTPTISEWLKIQ